MIDATNFSGFFHCMPTVLIANYFKTHLYLFEIKVGGGICPERMDSEGCEGKCESLIY